MAQLLRERGDRAGAARLEAAVERWIKAAIQARADASIRAPRQAMQTCNRVADYQDQTVKYGRRAIAYEQLNSSFALGK